MDGGGERKAELHFEKNGFGWERVSWPRGGAERRVHGYEEAQTA
jgi:hypothetical protein